MTAPLNRRQSYRLFGWTLLGLLFLLLAIEGWRYGVKPSQTDNRKLVTKELANAAQQFVKKQQLLLSRSQALAASLQPKLMQDRPSSELYDILASYDDFWSISLYQNNQPIVWKGFALQGREENPFGSSLEADIALRKKSNTIYWEAHVPFSLQKEETTIWYRLFTSFRIEQTNPLAIGNQSEFNLFRSRPYSEENYPLDFTLFNEPPKDVIQTHQLSNIAGDSVGVVYATAEKFEQRRDEWYQNTRFWRSMYVVFCFMVLILLFLGAVDHVSWSIALVIQLFFIGLGWFIFSYADLLSYWSFMLSETARAGLPVPVAMLSKTITNALFLLLASIAIARKLPFFNRKIHTNSYLSTISIAGIFGLVNAICIPLVFHWMYQSDLLSSIPLLDLRILPHWPTIFLYLIVGMSLLALGIILMALNRLLFRTTRTQIKLSASILAISFFISLPVVQLLILEQAVLNWIFFSSITGFILLAGIALGQAQDVIWITALSPLRKVVLGSILIAAISMPMFYQAYLNHLDKELLQTARSYAQDEDPQARTLTRQLLTLLEKEFRNITYADIRTNQSSLQARFTQTIQNFLAPKWNTYSFDLQLVSNGEELIADYSTNLNSPSWLDLFNIRTLEAATELLQITKSTIQPIVQQPDLINQQDYQTFYRGWIPIFGTSDNIPLAWILCSVYKERPQFNKPIRAVMASLTYEDWNNAFLMQKYVDSILVNTTHKGFAGYFPKYQELNNQEQQALKNDSLFYYNNQMAGATYRILLKKESEDQTIKISTTLAEARVVLFSFFRFSFTLLILGSVIAFLVHLLSQGKIHFLGKNKRFQDRILDSFLLATLIFLGFLIASSHYAIKQQNQEIVRQELFDKLHRLGESIETNRYQLDENTITPSFSLESLATPWNVDATLYANRQVTVTTTPQIYQQHLLPAALPYPIFNQLYVQKQRDAYSTVTLANQPLLIGYRSILSDRNKPIATIAIPTFLESPKYDQQLLETTSYLILVYLLVFGLFILGSVFISKSLTRPLSYIQRGLNKISGGDLNTTIPVTSQDEIGNLAKAYNKMVFRLKKLQEELAEAEREAAWKEMAQQVAHEIKNPLTPMKLNVQHLERQLKTNKYEGEELKKHIRKITANLIEQIQSLSNIASDFSKFSQPIKEDFSTLDLTALLTSVRQLYQHDDQLEIALQMPAEVVEVRGIADDLKRVFINMVKNAYEAMGEEGGRIVISLYCEQEHAFIEIEDNGSGIPEKNRGNVFVPSFSTKSGGTGLGLAICKKIVEAHAGSISFASVEGEGTTFVIKLPLSQ